jgi:hypothetical protein
MTTQKNEEQLYRGSHRNYWWLTSIESYMGTILSLCPEIVLNRYIAITSIDCGVLQLTDSEREAGWQIRRDIGYSPRILSTDNLQYQLDGREEPGYDEWYSFESPKDLGERSAGNMFIEPFRPAPGRAVVFVNWLSFVLHDSTSSARTLVELFWEQIDRIEPESYIADGCECLTFVSRDKQLFDGVFDRLSNLPQ